MGEGRGQGREQRGKRREERAERKEERAESIEERRWEGEIVREGEMSGKRVSP